MIEKFKAINNLYTDKIQKISFSYKRIYFDYFLEEMKTNNLVLIGLRQIGKTVLMEQLAHKYIFQKNVFSKDKEITFSRENLVIKNLQEIIYINLKSVPEKINSLDLTTFITKSNAKIVLIDEIQEIKNWSNFVQQLVDLNTKKRFIFSASNARALKDEIMINRAKTYYIKPLLFEEFKNIWENNSISKYLQGGTYPKIKQQNPLVQYRETVEEQIIDKIVLNDSKENVDLAKFKLTLKALANYIGNEVVISKLLNQNQSSRQTRTHYLKLMNESRLIRKIFKYKDQSSKPLSKIYFEDFCMINWFLNYENLDNNSLGSLIENTVFTYLDYHFNKKYGLENIYYYKPEKEIDFIIPSKKLLVEVKFVKNLNPNLVSKELNKIIVDPEVKGFKKIVFTRDVKEKVNGWNFIPLEELLKGTKNDLF